MEDTKLQLDRRDFIGLAAAMAAIGVGAALPVATAAAAQGPSTDFTRWLDSIPGKQRIVLDMREPNGGMALAWAWVWLFTAPPAYGVPESDVGTVVVLRHNGIPIALEDSAWKKYQLGEFFKIDDPATGKPAVRNPYYLISDHERAVPSGHGDAEADRSRREGGSLRHGDPLLQRRDCQADGHEA